MEEGRTKCISHPSVNPPELETELVEENTEFEQKHIEPVKEIILDKYIDNHEHTHKNSR